MGEFDQQLIVRTDRVLHEAYRRWAAASDRTLAAQVRTVMREAVPEKYIVEAEAAFQEGS